MNSEDMQPSVMDLAMNRESNLCKSGKSGCNICALYNDNINPQILHRASHQTRMKMPMQRNQECVCSNQAFWSRFRVQCPLVLAHTQ